MKTLAILFSLAVARGQDALSLKEAVRQSMARSKVIEASGASRDAMRARVTAAKAGLLPTVNYSESWARSDNPVFVFSSLLTQRQFSESNFGVASLNRPDFLNNFQSLVTGDQSLYDAGKTKHAVRTAKLGEDLSREDSRRSQLEVIAQVVRFYYDTQLGVEEVNVTAQAMRSAEADLERSEARRASGMATDAEVLSIRVHLAGVREERIRLFSAGFKSTIFPNAPVGLAFAGDPQYACANGYNCSDYKKFFPRVGFVIDPMGDGKMTVRASYGMFGDRLHQFFPNQMGFGPPFGNNISISNVSLSNPWASYPGGNAIPYLVNCSPVGHARHDCTFPTAGAYVRFNTDDYKPMYIHQWNLSIQRQVGDWLLSANYIGNSSIHLGTSENINPAVFLGTGACTLNTVSAAGVVVPTPYSTCSTTANQNQRRVLSLQNPLAGQYYAGIGAYDPGGTGSYNGLYLAANKRLSHNITLNTNYTWSHCISDIYDQQTGSAGVSPFIRRNGRSNCTGADQRHSFVLNMVAQAPRFNNTWLRRLASDWQVAPIFILRSGGYFSIVPGTDRALTTAPAQTVNLVNPDAVYAANKGVNGWLNPAAFALPALGTYGNLGQSNVQGPGMIQLNVALSRSFHVWGEKRILQVRADAFNLPNHLNPSNPVSNFSSSTFGQILSDVSGNNGLDAGDPRIIQLAMKFVF